MKKFIYSEKKTKRPFALILACLIQTALLHGQGKSQVYDNFDGSRFIHYGERTGVLDSAAKNPAPNGINNSEKCGLYVRNGSKKFANIKMTLPATLKDVESFATYTGIPPKIKMKVYTSAPAGTLIEILLTRKNGNNDYPAGTHSQYQAYTTKSNEWEEVEFKFSQVPQGSETTAAQVDQIVLLFNPNSSNSDTYYFDELSGPSLSEIKKEESPAQPVKTGVTDGQNNSSQQDQNSKNKGPQKGNAQRN